MSSLTVGAFLLLALLQQTDTVISLDGATRLQVDAPGGSITVTAWNRPDVRVRATHSSRTRVEVRRRGSTLTLDADADRGGAMIVDYEVSAPASLGLDLEGMYTRITVEGMNGEVTAETLQGAIRIVGGRGNVKASSTAGQITIEGAQGRVEVESVSQGVRITDSSGEIYVEGVGGDIILENVRARIVDVGTVGGQIRYSGTIQDDGRYSFASHGGSVDVGVPAGSNATFVVATLHGRVVTDLAGAPARFAPGQRTSFAAGNGSALVEVETFGGRISIVRR